MHLLLGKFACINVVSLIQVEWLYQKTKLDSKSRSPHLDEGAIKLEDKPRQESTMDKFNVRVSVMKDI